MDDVQTTLIGATVAMLLIAVGIPLSLTPVQDWPFVGGILAKRFPKKEPPPSKTEPELLVELDTAIEQWLRVLELPALAEETKLQEVSRQLSTLLLERLMLVRCPDRPSTNHQQSS